jgi:hypothetical protein
VRYSHLLVLESALEYLILLSKQYCIPLEFLNFFERLLVLTGPFGLDLLDLFLRSP